MGNSVVRSLHSVTRKAIYGNERMEVGDRFYGRTIGSILLLGDENKNSRHYRIEVLDENGRGIRCLSDDGTWVLR